MDDRVSRDDLYACGVVNRRGDDLGLDKPRFAASLVGQLDERSDSVAEDYEKPAGRMHFVLRSMGSPNLFEGSVRLGEQAQVGPWHVERLQITDRAGNRLGSQRFAEAGLYAGTPRGIRTGGHDGTLVWT